MKKTIPCFLMFVFLTSSVFSQDLIPFRNKEGWWGYCNSQKQIVIGIGYDWAAPFHKGVALVRLGRYFGIIAGDGAVVAPLYYEKASIPPDGRRYIMRKGVWYVFDEQRRKAVAVSYDPQLYQDMGLGTRFILRDEKYGLIDETARELLAPTFVKMRPFSEGLAAVRGESLWGYIDATGKTVLPLKYSYAGDFGEGLAPIALDDQYGFIDKDGKTVVACIYQSASPFSEGLAAVRRNDRWGYIDKSGREVVAPIYGTVWQFHEGLAAVSVLTETVSQWGFIDKNGIEVIRPRFDGVSGFNEGIAAVRISGKWGYINKKGDRIMIAKYDIANDFSEGLALIKWGDKWGYIDKKGTEYWEE